MSSEATYGFRKEPVVIVSLIMALVTLVVEFGVPITDAQQTAIQVFVGALLAVFLRSQVTSETTLQRAGISSPEVVTVANTPSREFAVIAVSDRTSVPVGGRSGNVAPMILMLLALAGAATLPACAAREGRAAPDTATLDIAGDVLDVTADFQSAVNDYVRVNGTNAVTDQIRGVIGANVLPAATRVRELVKSYHALSDLSLKASKASEIDVALRTLLSAYAEVSKSAEVSALASEFNTASMRVQALVAQIRAEIARAKG